jgi:predicted dehydrogenase
MSLANVLGQREPAVIVEAPFTEQVKVGVVGLGYWGPKLARNFYEHAGASLMMVVDRRQDRIDNLKELYPDVLSSDNYQAMLASDVDAVVVATPVHTHYALVKAALLAGKHVLVEKPLTADSRQARELIDLAAASDLVLMVGHTFEYNPAVEAIRDIVNSGVLGEIYYLNATRANLGLLQPDINVMWDLGPHDISILRFILGADPLRVSARGSTYINKRRRLEEVVYLHLVFKNDIFANVRLSWLDPVKQRQITIVGSQKMLVYDDISDNKVVVYDKGVEVPPDSLTESEFRASYRHGDKLVYPLQWIEPLQAECDHFLHAICTGTPPRSSGEVGLKVIKVLETAQRSLANGGIELWVEY